MKYVMVLALLGHGAGHVMGFLAAWTKLPMGFVDQPWVFGGDIMIQTAIGRVFGLVWLVALVGFIGANSKNHIVSRCFPAGVVERPGYCQFSDLDRGDCAVVEHCHTECEGLAPSCGCAHPSCAVGSLARSDRARHWIGGTTSLRTCCSGGACGFVESLLAL